MQVPINIEIKLNGKRTAFLSPKADELKDVYSDIRLNGESTLEFTIPSTSQKLEEITPECEIWAGARVYRLLKDDAVDTIRDSDNKLWSKFMAVERGVELDSSYIEPSISNDPTARPPADLAVLIVGGGSNLTGGLYATGTAGHALYAILQGSGWTLGTVDVIGIRDLEMEKVSRLELIKAIQNIWGGYLIWDSVNKIVHLRDANEWQNYTGFQVRYRKNLKHITRTESNKLVTKLYAFGHDDLDIANVNGGKKFITNNTFTPYEYVGIYKNQDIYNQVELKEKAIAELSFICRPRYLYRIKIVDLRTLPEYSHEDFNLGDMIDIIDPSVAPDSPRPRLIRHRYNIFKPWDCELEIGDPEERLVERLKASFNTNKFIDNKFNGNGDFSGNSLENGTVTDKKIKSLTADKITAGTIDAQVINVINLKAENITTGFLDADRIKVGSISIGKVDEEFVPGLNLLENPIFSSYASKVNTIDGKVATQATLIQQNSQQISLQAISISNLGADIARVDVKANNINLTVGRLEGNVDDLDYDMYNRYGRISIMQDNINLSVRKDDVISSINLSPERIEINAKNIDLNGITHVNKSLRLGSSDYDKGIIYFHNNATISAESYGTGVGLRLSGTDILIDGNTMFPWGYIYFNDNTRVVFEGNVDFSRANVTGL